MKELEPRYKTTTGSGSKSFVEIEKWTLKDVVTQDGNEYTIRNQLVKHEWLEASKGEDLFQPCVIAAYLHFLDLICNNPDYLWRFIYYRRENGKNHLHTQR